jgi:hypothetical protein
MPRIRFFLCVTTSLSICEEVPLTPLKCQPVPGLSGHQGLSTVVTKPLGLIVGEYLPWIGARAEADCDPVGAEKVPPPDEALLPDDEPPPDDPQPSIPTAKAAAAKATAAAPVWRGPFFIFGSVRALDIHRAF